MRPTISPLAVALGLALAACSSSAEIPTTALTDGGGSPAPSVASPAASPATGGYALSAEEKALDCRRLTGRMKIRILSLRDTRGRSRTSELSRSLQSAQVEFGASATGSDPDGDLARDRAMLEAYNAELAAKGCKTLDLATELKP